MNSSVYIHIPFCSNICSYCDFAKVFYNEKLVDLYLIALEKEIKLNYKFEIIKTIYIGGGTPSSLNYDQLKKLFEIINIFKLDKNCEFTIECNVEDTDLKKLKIFKKNNVNRLSIGVQSFNDKNLLFLNRKHNKLSAINLIEEVKKIFSNISIDLIYGLPNQTISDLEDDINEFIKLDINHISCYSLIIEKHTKLYNDKIENINEDLDYEMYKIICNKLNDNNFKHYEISNFSKKSFESKHNLTYWNNNNYYGFGVGASGYIKNVRYSNTKSIQNYIKGNYLLVNEDLNRNTIIENELILGFRKIEGINLNEFNKKYNLNLLNVNIIRDLIKKGYLEQNCGKIYIRYEYIYLSNSILQNFIGLSW